MNNVVQILKKYLFYIMHCLSKLFALRCEVKWTTARQGCHFVDYNKLDMFWKSVIQFLICFQKSEFMVSF